MIRTRHARAAVAALVLVALVAGCAGASPETRQDDMTVKEVVAPDGTVCYYLYDARTNEVEGFDCNEETTEALAGS
jgi:hypothetical protein